MSVYYHNLFNYYRGPGSESVASERQLENNATKALILVLQNSNRDVVLAPFLREILRDKFEVHGVAFALQRSHVTETDFKRRFALVIGSESKLDTGKYKWDGVARPDAWIWRAGDFGVLIEVKIYEIATLAQVRNHIRNAGWKGIAPIARSWAQVYEAFKKIFAHDLDSTSKFLVKQFLEFLRMNALDGSNSFEVEDFAYLMQPEENHELSRSVTRKFKHLAEQIAAHPLMRKTLKLSRGDESMTVGKGSWWINFGSEATKAQFHFTFYFRSDGLAIECIGTDKKLSKSLVGRIESHPQEFIDCLKPIPRLDGSYCLRLQEAYYAHPNSPHKGEKTNNWIQFGTFHPRTLTKALLEHAVVGSVTDRLEKKAFRPEIILEWKISAEDALRTKNVAELIVEAIEPMIPFYKFAIK